MFLSKLTNNSDLSEHVTESMLHQFNSLASHAVTHPGTAAEQAHGIKLCCCASLRQVFCLLWLKLQQSLIFHFVL